MNSLNKNDALKLLQSGQILVQKRYPDFGTTSLFRPIKRFNKYTSKFWIGETSVNPKSGHSIVSNHVKRIKSDRQGLVEVIEWSLK